MSTVHYLSSDDVADLADPKAYIDVVSNAYQERGQGAPTKPRTTLTSPGDPGIMTGYLAILPAAGYMGGYTYSAGFGDEDAWLVTPLFDADSGRLLAIIDGAAMNPYKTGATGAVGVDTLARAEASRLGLIGSGAQARGQLRAVAQVRDLDEVLVYSPTKSHREAFASEFDEQLDASVRAVDDSSRLVPAVDMLITATNASEPVFDGTLLEPGTHVTAMGQYNPTSREVDADTIAQSTYVPDLRERAFQDAGAFLLALEDGSIDEDHIHAELGEVIVGDQPGRTTQTEITLFDSGGTALETVAAAGMLYERAMAAARGIELPLSPASEAFPGR